MAKKQEEKVDKSKAMELAVASIEKSFGTGAILFGKAKPIPNIEFLSTQCLSVDMALGGGFAKGRIIEIYGPESSGKTTLGLHAIANAQRLGMNTAFVDVEHAFDPTYAENLGINLEKIAFAQPDSGEQALQIVEALCGACGIIVIDSVSALLPRAEIEKEIGDNAPGRQAALMSQAMRKLAPLSAKTGTTLVFINQIRMKIGVMFGNPETVSGGNALKFYSSMRIDIRRIGGVKQGEEVIANKTKIKVVKNKVFPPFKTAEFEIKYGEGIDFCGDLLELAVKKDIVNKSGSWYSYGEDKLGQGKIAVTAHLKENEKLYQELETKVREAYGI